MKSESPWFYHDVGARNSRKLRIVRATFSASGYAWFFMMLEMLREEPDYMLDLSHEHNIAVILAELAAERAEFDKFIALCILVGLFAMDGDKLFSPSLLVRMENYMAVRERYRQNGRKGGRPAKKEPSGYNFESQNKPSGYENITKKEPSGSVKITDKNRVDKNRTEEIGLERVPRPKFQKPELAHVAGYFAELGSIHAAPDAERFQDYYEANGWRVGRNPMKDWKAAARNWHKNNFTNSNGNSTTNGKSNYQKRSDFDPTQFDKNGALSAALEAVDRARGRD